MSRSGTVFWREAFEEIGLDSREFVVPACHSDARTPEIAVKIMENLIDKAEARVGPIDGAARARLRARARELGMRRRRRPEPAWREAFRRIGLEGFVSDYTSERHT